MDDGRLDDEPPLCRVWTGLVLCGAVLLAGCASHPTVLPGTPTSDTERPALLIDEFRLPVNTLDAGELPGDRAMSWTFTLRNVGRLPLVVAGVSDSCGGCLGAFVDGSTLAAGEATPLHVTYDPRIVDEFGHEVRHILRVQSNDPGHPIAEFHLRGRLP